MSEYNKCCVPSPISEVVATPSPSALDVDFVFTPKPECTYTAVCARIFGPSGVRDDCKDPVEGADHFSFGELLPGEYLAIVYVYHPCGSCMHESDRTTVSE